VVSCELAAGEDLQAMDREELIALVIQQDQTLAEIIDERDAARALNELCHF
jgi:hypothetical protein